MSEDNISSGEVIIRTNIEEEMKSAYIDYSMSVIVSRALPDVRDGLKPVHRRVLFGMEELGLISSRSYKKSARIVGEVLGKYHPHGDLSVYDAMVRMAQPWSLRYPLIEGQGNFGSIDGDSPAAMRYTEVRLHRIAEETLKDLDKNTVDFQFNFDDTLQEPTVMPTRIPTLLVNGASGIAVGMATNMAPHNLGESIDAIIAYINNNDISISELNQYIKGPDFPTGGIIYGISGIKDAYETGKGRVVVRARTEVETSSTGRETIVVKEIPYQVNKLDLINKIAELVNEGKIEGIAYVNDESDRDGMRLVIILKKDAIANVVLNHLYKLTPLQNAFSINNIALVNGRPRVLNLKQLIEYFVKHRHDVIVRRTQYELEQAQKRAHILEGLLIALDHIDEIIKLIKASKNPVEAKDGLMAGFGLTELQAKAILDMRLQALTGLERQKIKDEYAELMKIIEFYNRVLAEEPLRMTIIKDELIEIKAKYNDERRTEIVQNDEDFNPEDFYADDEMVITISRLGYIKRTLLTEYRTQGRGGIGVKGSTTRDEDFIEHIFSATMHNTILFFTKKGKCYWLKVYEIPEGSKGSKGRALQNVINIEQDDIVQAYINVKTLNDEEYLNNNFIVLCTERGLIKKTSLEAYSRPRQNGINAINVTEGDNLIEARLTNGNNHIIISARQGKALHFHESKVRPMGRTAMGVRGMKLAEGKNDRVIGMVCVESEDHDLLVVSEKGYGKRSKVADYRVTNRGGKGVKTINITQKTGKLIAIKGVTDGYDLMIITRNGLTIRISIDDIRVAGRATQGVRLINLRDNDAIASITIVDSGENQDIEKETVLNEVVSTETAETADDDDAEDDTEVEPDEEQQE